MRVLQRTISSENRLLADGPGPFTPLLPCYVVSQEAGMTFKW